MACHKEKERGRERMRERKRKDGKHIQRNNGRKLLNHGEIEIQIQEV